MPRRHKDPRQFAEKAERWARIGLGYLVFLCVILTIIFVTVMWVLD
jgi:hypothetical protein